MILISPFEIFYLMTWLSALALSVGLIRHRPEHYEIASRTYWRFLLEPWKVITFIVATAALAIAAPYSGDPTWDYADSIIAALFTFTTAPWSIGVIYRAIRHVRIGWNVFVAICFFLTPCWSYDLYILLRDGIYPATWVPNLVASGTAAVSAGLFWNLAWVEEKGSVFAFTLDNWPEVGRTPPRKLILPALIIMAPFVLMLAWFVFSNLEISP